MSACQATCPTCQSTHAVNNSNIHHGTQHFKCRQCGRQLVQAPQHKIIAPATKTLIDKLLLETRPFAGIARVTGVSEPWLQRYVKEKDQNRLRQVSVRAKKRGA